MRRATAKRARSRSTELGATFGYDLRMGRPGSSLIAALIFALIATLFLAGGCGTSRSAAGDETTMTTAIIAAPPTTASVTSSSGDPTPITTLGDGVVAHFKELVEGNAQPLFDSFNPDLKAQMPLEILQGTWDTTETMSGPYQFTKGMRYEDDGSYRAVILEAVFEQRMIDIRFVFDENDQVSGMYFEQPPDAE